MSSEREHYSIVRDYTQIEVLDFEPLEVLSPPEHLIFSQPLQKIHLALIAPEVDLSARVEELITPEEMVARIQTTIAAEHRYKPSPEELDILIGILTADEIGDMFGKNPYGVRAWVRHYRLGGHEFEHSAPRPVRLADEQHIIALHSTDISFNELCEKSGYPAFLMHKFLAEQGLAEPGFKKAARLRKKRSDESNVSLWGLTFKPLDQSHYALVEQLFDESLSAKSVYRQLQEMNIPDVTEIQIAHYLTEKHKLLPQPQAVSVASRKRHERLRVESTQRETDLKNKLQRGEPVLVSELPFIAALIGVNDISLIRQHLLELGITVIDTISHRKI